MSIPDWPWLAELRDLGLAFLIGLNRERLGRSAGLRTFPLVSVASCAFILVADARFGESHEAMARVIAGVIGGIGFIGGGAILKGEREVHGTATAASLWATAAIGLAVGLGAHAIAVALAAFTVLTLLALGPLKRWLDG